MGRKTQTWATAAKDGLHQEGLPTPSILKTPRLVIQAQLRRPQCSENKSKVIKGLLLRVTLPTSKLRP